MATKRLRNTSTGEVLYGETPYQLTYPGQLLLWCAYKTEASYLQMVALNGKPSYEYRLQMCPSNEAALLARFNDLTNTINLDTTLTLPEKLIKHTWEQLLEEANDTTNKYFERFGATSGNWIMEEV